MIARVRRLSAALFVVAVLSTLTAAIAPRAVEAQTRPATITAADVDGVVQPFLAKGPATAIVVGIVTDEGTSFYPFGRYSKDDATQPTADSIFEIGSVTKVFTAIALADLAAKGEVKLDDPVRLHLPKGVTVPTRHGKEITLLHLATHTSGLPRVPLNLALRGLDDPYAESDERELYAVLRGMVLLSDPGQTTSYSNLGFALLGDALSRTARTTYEQLILDRICAPLTMSDTRITLSPEQRSRLVPGHTAGGKRAANWNFQAYAGCGALRSTARDMAKFLRANMGLDPTPLLAVLRDAQRPRRRMSDRPEWQIGLAWMTSPLGGADQRRTMAWHNGATGGYSSFVGFVNGEAHCGVVVLVNATVGAEYPADAVGVRLLERLASVGKDQGQR